MRHSDCEKLWGEVFGSGATEIRKVGFLGLSSLFVLILKWLKSTEREGKKSGFFFSPNLKKHLFRKPCRRQGSIS